MSNCDKSYDPITNTEEQNMKHLLSLLLTVCLALTLDIRR